MSVSVRPRWKQGLCGNQTTSIGLSSPMQVTPSLVRLTTASVAQPTQVLASVEERTTGRLALPGNCPVTGHAPIPTVSWLWIGIGSLQTQTQPSEAERSGAERSGAVGFLPPSDGGECQTV